MDIVGTPGPDLVDIDMAFAEEPSSGRGLTTDVSITAKKAGSARSTTPAVRWNSST